jgi:hypothetical protein
VAALVVALPAAKALAGPFVYITMKARVLQSPDDPENPANTRPFMTGYLGVKPGDYVQYQLFLTMAAPPAHNTTGTGTDLTSVVFVRDGISSGKFMLWEDPAAPIQAGYEYYNSSVTVPFKWDNEMLPAQQQVASQFLKWSLGVGASGGTFPLDPRNATGAYDLRNFRYITQTATPFFAGVAGTYVVSGKGGGTYIIPAEALLGYGRMSVYAMGSGGDSEMQMGYKKPPSPWWPGNEVDPYVGDQNESVLGAVINNWGTTVVSAAKDADPFTGFNTVTLYKWLAPIINIGTQIVNDPSLPYTVTGVAVGGPHAQIASVQWDLDNNGIYEKMTTNLILSAADMAAMGGGVHTIGMRITSTEGDSGTGTGALNIIPEPATLALLGLGLVGILRRRRR